MASEKMARQVTEYARSAGKKTISVGYHRPWCDISLPALNPFQWLGYFVNCDCVITTMYHGMIFAALNRKEFCMFSTAYRKHKIGNLLSDIGLSHRFLDESEPISEVFNEKIDYSKVNPLIESKRHESEEFLLDALR